METAIGPNADSVLLAAGLADQGYELRVEGPPPFMCGREVMYGVVYLDLDSSAGAREQLAETIQRHIT